MTNIVDAAIEYIKELFSGNVGGHDASHTLRVYHNAVHIAEKENACKMQGGFCSGKIWMRKQ